MRLPKYLQRLLLFTLLISTLPVVCLGLFSYVTASTSLLDKVTKGNQQLLSQTLLGVEQNFRIIDSSLTQFSSLPDIIKTTQIPLDIREYEAIRKTNQYMDYTFTQEMGIANMYFVNFQHDWSILPDRIGPMDPKHKLALLKLYSSLKLPSMLIEHSKEANLGLENANIDYGLLFVRPIRYLSLEASSMVIARIEYDQLSKWIAGSNKLGNTYILNENMRIIGSNLSDLTQQIALEAVVAREINDQLQPAGYVKTRYMDEIVYIFYQRSSNTQWTYISVVPKSLIVQESNVIGWVTLLTGLGIIALLLVIAYKGSLSIYSPIENLFRSLSNGKQPSHTTDEIDFISNSLSNLRQQITAQGKELHKFNVLKLFHRELLHNELKEKIIGTHPHFQAYTQFSVLVLQIDTLAGTRYSESDRDLLLFAAMNILQETVPETNRLSPVLISQSLVCLVGLEHDTLDENKRELLDLSNRIVHNINEYLSLSASVGISRAFRNLHLASEAYEEGIDALTYRVRFGNQSILFIEDVEPASNHHRSLRYPELLSNQLRDAIKLQDRAKSDDLFEEFIRILFGHEGTSTEYQMVLLRLLSDIMKLAHLENNNPSMVLSGQSLPKELLALQTPGQITTWFKSRVIQPTIRHIQERTEQQYKKISDDMVRLIELETENEMTLEYLGTKLNYSPAYLSQVFRKEQGMSFTDYLTKHRIQIAKQWLLETDLSVNEIAQRLNYTNPQNFIRSFKREIGVTPGRYREERR